MMKYPVVVALVLAMCLQDVLAESIGSKICIFASLCKAKPNDCPKTCPNTVDFLCGTDGMSYQNECFLKRANCERETKVSIAYRKGCDRYEKPKPKPKPTSTTTVSESIEESIQVDSEIPRATFERQVVPREMFD